MAFEIKDSGERRQTATGAQRDRAVGKGRFELLSPIADERAAKWLELGAQKYEARNWEKGMPLSWYVDSARRHINKFLEGHRDEDHLAAARFNIDCLIHTEEMIRRGKLPDSLYDLPSYVSKDDVLSQTILGLAERAGVAAGKAVVGSLNAGPTPMTPAQPERIYVAGPFSAPTEELRDENFRIACYYGMMLARKGHHVHVPHAATAPWHGEFAYEDFMELDFTYLQKWATALFYIGPSPGADREKAEAERLGLKVYKNISQVPSLPARGNRWNYRIDGMPSLDFSKCHPAVRL